MVDVVQSALESAKRRVMPLQVISDAPYPALRRQPPTAPGISWKEWPPESQGQDDRSR